MTTMSVCPEGASNGHTVSAGSHNLLSRAIINAPPTEELIRGIVRFEKRKPRRAVNTYSNQWFLTGDKCGTYERIEVYSPSRKLMHNHLYINHVDIERGLDQLPLYRKVRA